MVKVYFDGIEVENPVEWRELAIAVKYSVKDQITTFEFPNEMTFVKDAYEYLHSRIDSACSLIDVDVRMLCNGNWERVVYGVIFIGDCSFRLLECSVQVKIQDDAFSARIKNNYNVKVGLGLLETKNGLPITPPVHRSILFFEPSAGG